MSKSGRPEHDSDTSQTLDYSLPLKTCYHPGCTAKFPPSVYVAGAYYCLEHATLYMPAAIPHSLYVTLHKPHRTNGAVRRKKTRKKTGKRARKGGKR